MIQPDYVYPIVDEFKDIEGGELAMCVLKLAVATTLNVVSLACSPMGETD